MLRNTCGSLVLQVNKATKTVHKQDRCRLTLVLFSTDPLSPVLTTGREHRAPFSSVGRAASHVQRLCSRCSRPGFESRPRVLGSSPGFESFAACHSPPLSLILFPAISEAVQSIKPYKGLFCYRNATISKDE